MRLHGLSINSILGIKSYDGYNKDAVNALTTHEKRHDQWLLASFCSTHYVKNLSQKGSSKIQIQILNR